MSRGRGVLAVMDRLCLSFEYKCKTTRIQQRVTRILKHLSASDTQTCNRLIQPENGRWGNVRHAFLWWHSCYCLLESKLSSLSPNKTNKKKEMVIFVDTVLCRRGGIQARHRTEQQQGFSSTECINVQFIEGTNIIFLYTQEGNWLKKNLKWKFNSISRADANNK